MSGSTTMHLGCSWCLFFGFDSVEQQRAHAAVCDKHPAVAALAAAEARATAAEEALALAVGALEWVSEFLSLKVEGLLSFHDEPLAVDDCANQRHQIAAALAAARRQP